MAFMKVEGLQPPLPLPPLLTPMKCIILCSLETQLFGCFELKLQLGDSIEIPITHLKCASYKLPLNMQRPVVTNELRKERYATYKGRKSVISYVHTMYVASQLAACQYLHSYTSILIKVYI